MTKMDQQPEDPFFTTDEVGDPNNTVGAQHNPEASGMP
jgi:hypothetical protein